MNRNFESTRRQYLTGLMGIGAASVIHSALSDQGKVNQGQAHASSPQDAINNEVSREAFSDKFQVKHKKIRQSVMAWCYNPMPMSELIDHCAAIGIEAIEGIDSKYYPLAIEKGMKIALIDSHGFMLGPVDPANHERCIRILKESIDKAVKFGAPSVITFTGMSVPGMDTKTADENCLACWREVMPYAEKHKVTLVLEHLNSRDSSHPMKGHPGYYGDDVDHCIELVKKMDSPYFKLLFDVYHVQIMNGDVIRRIREYHPWIGHYHTAGNPGRCEMDEKQEINYLPILQTILETGYQGFTAQEFIPTWEDPVRSLRHGAWVMDVQ